MAASVAEAARTGLKDPLQGVIQKDLDAVTLVIAFGLKIGDGL